MSSLLNKYEIKHESPLLFKPFMIRAYSNAATNYVGFAIIDKTGFIWAVRRDLDKAKQRLKELEEMYAQGILSV